MAGSEYVLEPGTAAALHRLLPVIEAVVSKNLRLGIVGSYDLCAAVQQAMGLIKIPCLGDIVGDDLIALPRLLNAVDLHRKQHRDSCSIQFARQHDDGRSSPTVAEENDARLRFFLIAEDAIVIAVEQAKNGFVGGSPVAVLKDLDYVACRKVLPNALRQFHRAVARIIMALKAARKTDEDVRDSCGRTTGNGAVGGHEAWPCRAEDCKNRNQNRTSRRAGHVGSWAIRWFGP